MKNFWIEFEGEGARAFVYENRPDDWIEDHPHYIKGVECSHFNELLKDARELVDSLKFYKSLKHLSYEPVTDTYSDKDGGKIATNAIKAFIKKYGEK